MKNNIMDYFHEQVDYPKDIAFAPLPLYVMNWYVSDSYLNGFINYVEIKKAYVLDRYNKWDDKLPDHESLLKVRNDKREWTSVICETKLEKFNLVTVNGAIGHSSVLRDFSDDVLILGKAYNKDKTKHSWILFWYDCDSSDCGIGRFKVGVSDEVVIAKFDSYATDPNSDYRNNSKEIPLHYFSGWISS